MKHFFAPYSPFFYVAFCSLIVYVCMGGERIDIAYDHTYLSLIDRKGLMFLVTVFGAIWGLYALRNSVLYSRKLIWYHFAASFPTAALLCWYHVQDFTGKTIAWTHRVPMRRGLDVHELSYYVLPGSPLLLFLFVAAQAFFIIHLVKGTIAKEGL